MLDLNVILVLFGTVQPLFGMKPEQYMTFCHRHLVIKNETDTSPNELMNAQAVIYNFYLKQMSVTYWLVANEMKQTHFVVMQCEMSIL